MANVYTGKNKIAQTSSSTLPFAPVEYTAQYHNLLNNILRLYFAQIDNVTGSLLSTAGGAYLEFPHVSASDSTDQTTADNTATVVRWNTIDSNIGFTFNYPSTPPAPANPLAYSVTANKPGIYKIDYSLQFANTDNNKIHEVFVWLEIAPAGTTTFGNVAGSGSKFSVPGEHTTSDGYLVAYSSLTFQVTTGDSIRLMWATSKAYVVSPAADGIYMEAYAAQTSPFAMSAIPSAVGTIAFVSNIPA